jgi:exonuclease VII small subunit
MTFGMYSPEFYASPFAPNDYYDGKITDLSLTVNVNVSSEEHDLLLAVREYNRAVDVAKETDTVLEKARDEASEAMLAKSDARFELDEAMSAVRHSTAY